jgi:hypothetical protein
MQKSTFLGIMREIILIGSLEWATVFVCHKNLFRNKNRDMQPLCQKFNICWDDTSIGDPNVSPLLQKAKHANMIKMDSGGASLQDLGNNIPDGGGGLCDSGGNLDRAIDSEEEDYEVD